MESIFWDILRLVPPYNGTLLGNRTTTGIYDKLNDLQRNFSDRKTAKVTEDRIPFAAHSQKGKFIETEDTLVLVKG